VRLVWDQDAWDDYLYWQQKDDTKVRRINELIAATMRAPSVGIGKPEPLKHQLAGSWSRRIDDEYRLVYRVSGDDLIILQARYHY
jgi:toxin YoeB